MGAGRLSTVVRHVHGALSVCQVESLGDRQLLELFLTDRDMGAFEALVRRHGPTVLGVCRRVLGEEHDAEDAFQATFLVLSRKAASIRQQEALGPWLYGVARRTARKARALAARRRSRERQVPNIPHPEVFDDWPADDTRRLLDEELDRLPDNYRAAVMLCDLQGLGRPQAAQQLGWREGTLSSRLARGRALLRRRLTRRGITPAVTVGAALGQFPKVHTGLISSTVKAVAAFAAGPAAGAVAANILALTEGVSRAMMLSKLRILIGIACVAALGVALSALHATGAAEPRAPGPVDRPIPFMDPDSSNEAAKVSGTWKMAAYEVGGLQVGPDAFRSREVSMTFESDNTAVVKAIDAVTGQPFEVRGTYRLYTGTSPKAIDVTVRPPGQTREITVYGIYAADADTLRGCFSFPGDETRPASFDQGPKSRTVRVTLRRNSADKAKRGTLVEPFAPDHGTATEIDPLRRENCEPRAEIDRLREIVMPRDSASGKTIAAHTDRFKQLLASLVERQKSDGQILESLYLATLTRLPTAEEKRFAEQALALHPDRKDAFTNLLWLMTNSKEFGTDLDERAKLDPHRAGR
jgi:RNA polymerase sigma factor (sigma-70 family)